MRPKTVKVTLKTPFLTIEGVWEPNDAERAAAWELYVELITRVAVVPLPADRGSDREALTSLYQLFGVHRQVLRQYGPAVAKRTKKSQYSLGYLATTALNYVIRPFLSNWHPLLTDFEATRHGDVGLIIHERNWPQHDEFRAELEKVRGQLQIYGQWLSHACNVPDLLTVES